MKKKFIILFLFYNNIFSLHQPSPHIITFFIRPIPKYIEEKIDIKKIKKSISKPENVLKQFILQDMPSHLQSGIYAIYAGFVTFSDFNGQITFERKTVEPKINLLITEDIKPIPVSPFNTNTILGFVVNPKAYSQYYLLERNQDPETQVISWKVTEQDIPKDQKIPYNTIILIANPKNIIVLTGTTSTIMSENLLLPDIYVTKNTNSTLYAIRFLKVRQYFSPTKNKYEYKQEQYQQKMHHKF